MKCFQHADVDAAGYCRQCGKGLCDACRRDVRGATYCEDCLVASVGAGAATKPGSPNPRAAFWLGFIPGVGAFYNGEYGKGVVHLLIFGGIVTLLHSPLERHLGPFLGFAMIAWFFYMAFEARESARRRAAGQAPSPPLGFEGLGWGNGARASAAGPVVLIVVGGVLLMGQFGMLEWFEWLVRLWPVALIALGGWMLYKRSS